MTKLDRIYTFEFRNENSKVVEVTLEDQDYRRNTYAIFKTSMANMYKQLNDGNAVLTLEGRYCEMTIYLHEKRLKVNRQMFNINDVKLTDLVCLAKRLSESECQ